MLDREVRRVSFNRVATLYDEARPQYPEELIDQAVALSGIPPAGRMLEVGCGTGQATLAFARRGFSILCIELGPQLAEIAQEKLREYPKVEIQVSSFEDWVLQENAFDLVVGASCFHLLDPEIAYKKSARALKGSGALALLRNKQPRVESAFSRELQQLYDKYVPEISRRRFREQPAEQDSEALAIERSGLFEEVLERRVEWSREYDAHAYVKLLNTYSDHNCLPEEKKRAFFPAVAELIERHGGRFTKPYVGTLYVAKKK